MTRQNVLAYLRRAAERDLSRLAVRITQDLRHATPVDTTNAQWSWEIGTGPVTLGPGDPVRNPPFKRARQLASITRIASYKLPQGDIHIGNDASYIIALNNGHSQQQPVPGYIQATIQGTVATASARASR